MYRICPKCGHERSDAAPAAADACPACGLVYAKWLKQKFVAEAPSGGDARSRVDAAAVTASISGLLLHVEERTNPFEFWARAVVWVLFLIWGWHFISTDIETLGLQPSFMHRINLPFHEAGHIFFRPFGRTMMYLGGSIGQVLMPLVVTLVFLLKYQNTFAASIGLWWTAQSLMDVAPYIADATAMNLVLLGGVTGWDAPGRHDWQQILIEFGCLECDRTLAAWVDGIGIVLMLSAFAWGGAVLWRQYHRLDDRF